MQRAARCEERIVVAEPAEQQALGLDRPRRPRSRVTVYDSDGHDAVDAALTNAIKKSVAQIDHASAKELKAGLEEAQAGMGGGG